MKANKYYGPAAANYESRKQNPKWHREHEIVAGMLGTGPVLDVPCGTGRFFELYESRGVQYTGLDISGDMLKIAAKRCRNGSCGLGDVFDLSRFDDGQFSQAIVIRLLQWLSPSELANAMIQLARVSHEVVFSVRLGPEGHGHHYESYTHDEQRMMRRLAGLMVTDRQHVSHRLECDYWVYRARRVTYADVEDQFTDRPAVTIQHLVNEWAPRVGLEPAPVGRPSVRCEYWTAQQHRDMIEEQATFDPRARTTKPPRRDSGPITIVERRGKRGMIDGRHRSEKRSHDTSGAVWPVLVVELGQ